MAMLGDLAKLVRSKNAGPFWLTIDIIFDDAEAYRRARVAESSTCPEIYFEVWVVGEVGVANRDTGVYGAYPGIARQSYIDFAAGRVACHIVTGRLLIGVVQVRGHRTDGVVVAEYGALSPPGGLVLLPKIGALELVLV